MNIVAVDWDREKLRVAVAVKRPGGAGLAHAVTVDAADDAKSMADALRKALPDVRWTKARLVAVVGGEHASFRLLKLPPTPDAELPNMVGLLADKEFGAGDEGAIDYVPLSGDAGSQRTVLAARAPKATVTLFEKLAQQLDATPARMVLRACGAASAVARVDSTVNEGACLVTAPAGEADDLIVLQNGLPAIIRTARGDFAGGGEVRRTLSSASLQLGERVERVASVGGEADGWLTLADIATSQWRLPKADAEGVDGLAGVVGAALDEVDKLTPPFDLLNPKKVEVDTAPRRRQMILAGATAAVVLLGIGQAYLSLRAYDTEREEIQTQIAGHQKTIEKFQPYADRAELVERWLDSDVNWLDEIELLGREMRPMTLDAKEFPADDDVMLTSLTATATGGKATGGGQIMLDAVARDADAPTALEQRVRDDRREMKQSSLEQADLGKYVWRFKPTIKIVAPLTAEAPAAEEPAAESAVEEADEANEAPAGESAEGPS